MQTAKDYLRKIIRPPMHQGHPHQEYKDWIMCKVCAPHYQKYLREKDRLKEKYAGELVLSNQFKT